MLKLFKSHFEYVYSNDNCVIAGGNIATQGLKAHFYDAAATESAVQTLVALCEDSNEQQHQMPTSQKTQDHNKHLESQ